MNEQHPIHNAAFKATGAMTLGFAGLTISEWAAVAGLVYSLLLIGEWVWKRILKPLAIAHGWILSKVQDAKDTE